MLQPGRGLTENMLENLVGAPACCSAMFYGATQDLAIQHAAQALLFKSLVAGQPSVPRGHVWPCCPWTTPAEAATGPPINAEYHLV